MSFAGATALIEAVNARAADDDPDRMMDIMDIAKEEIQKATQHNASLSQKEFNAGYDAMLAGIDTTNNPPLTKAIADYRAARTKKERDALKPILEKVLEQTALALERDLVPSENSKCCSDSDSDDNPFDHLLRKLTDRALKYAMNEAELNPHLANIEKVKTTSDRMRIGYLRDDIEKKHLTIANIIEMFIAERCRGFSWKFLIALPEFIKELPKYYKCRYPKECMVCVCYIENRGWITDINHPDLVPVEHYPSVMTQLISEAFGTQDATNLNMVYEHFSQMPNFDDHNQKFKKNIIESNITKNRLIKKWLRTH